MKWSCHVKKKVPASDRAYMVCVSCTISILLYFVIRAVLPVHFSMPDTTAINWLTVNKYPKDQDYFFFFSFCIFVYVVSVAIWLVWIWIKTRR